MIFEMNSVHTAPNTAVMAVPKLEVLRKTQGSTSKITVRTKAILAELRELTQDISIPLLKRL